MRKIKIAVLYLAKFSLLFLLARYFTKKHPRILCYHGGSIGDECEFNNLLFVKKDLFEKRINWLLKHNFNFINLQDINGHNENSVVITFDDGWYSTYSELIPVLFKNSIPSTLYLSTLYYQDGWPIVPVAIRYIASRSSISKINLNKVHNSLDGFCEVNNPKSLNHTIKILSELFRIKKSTLFAEDLINNFAIECGLGADQLGLESRRFSFMFKSELLLLDKMKCSVELHGHKHEYPIGKLHDFEIDILECKRILIEDLKINGQNYCYPSGNFDRDASIILKRNNVLTATTCLPGLVVDLEKQRFFLPRFLDGGSIYDIEFEAEIMGFNHYLRKIFKKNPFPNS